MTVWYACVACNRELYSEGQEYCAECWNQPGDGVIEVGPDEVWEIDRLEQAAAAHERRTSRAWWRTTDAELIAEAQHLRDQLAQAKAELEALRAELER